MTLNARSEAALRGVHADLVRIVRRAAEIAPTLNPALGFVVTEGLRTRARQQELFKAGASQLDGVTKIGRHQTGHAVDLMATVNGKGRWDWPLYQTLAQAMQAAADEFGTPLIWGGSWRTLRDGPHFELPRGRYP